MTDIVDAFERWLPYPVYRFVGGPMDGKELTVSLIETSYGYIAPPVWEVYETPPADFSIGAVANNIVVSVHRYRFVSANPAGNIGHYEHVPSS
jgi:hypothetical protein